MRWDRRHPGERGSTHGSRRSRPTWSGPSWRPVGGNATGTAIGLGNATATADDGRRAALARPIPRSVHRTEALREKIERLKAMLDSSVPDGDLARIFEIAITETLARREARRFGRTTQPRKTVAQVDTRPTTSRYIPLPVRRASHERDGGECRFAATNGRKCASRRHLDLHHGIPWAHGGDRSPENIALMCRTHNQYLADLDYGKSAMDRHRKERVIERTRSGETTRDG